MDLGQRQETLVMRPAVAVTVPADSPRNDARQTGVFDVGKKQEERIWDRESLMSVRNRKNGSRIEAGNPCYVTCRRSYCSDSPRNDA